MTVIGLTGGIAAGKSTASEALMELGAVVIDADRIGHRSYEPGTPGFEKVVNAFGHDIVGKDGLVDRRVLGGKVFGAPGQMERLNAIVWPEIRNLIKDEIKQIRAQDPNALIVLEAAVLIEAEWQDLCDEVWVITTPVKTAVARLRSRNGLSEEAAMARINSQMTNKERLAFADVKIENSGTEEQLRAKMERPWRALEARLGRSRPATKKKPAAKPATKKAAAKPATKPAAKKAPAAKAPAKPAAKAATKPTTKPAAKKAPAKAAAKPATKSTTAAAKAGATAPAKKAVAASKAAPAAKSAAKTAVKPAAKPATRKATAKASSPRSSGTGSASRGTSRAGARTK